MEPDQAIEDRLFTPLSDHTLPSQFLAEPVAGRPTNFNREFIPIAAMPNRVATIIRQWSYHYHPQFEEIIEHVAVEFPPLVFSTWAIETAQGTPMRELSFFVIDATPALLDLEIALTRWLPPPDECLGTVSVRSPEDRSGWSSTACLASLASFIAPYPDARPVPGRGSYRFLIQQDGEPLAIQLGLRSGMRFAQMWHLRVRRT